MSMEQEGDKKGKRQREDTQGKEERERKGQEERKRQRREIFKGEHRGERYSYQKQNTVDEIGMRTDTQTLSTKKSCTNNSRSLLPR